ncbi:hypothetical protein [Bradyrhizobium sp. HKCCYLS20291]|uniref:hypothetical protein n=1 Tax=Bradyrhizobium sp. HKCCYLS20291 TaxID=3420766 RepID=UPI003EBDE20A
MSAEAQRAKAEAIQGHEESLDCFVASLLAMTKMSSVGWAKARSAVPTIYLT